MLEPEEVRHAVPRTTASCSREGQVRAPGSAPRLSSLVTGGEPLHFYLLTFIVAKRMQHKIYHFFLF